jgi:hypothetical protein
MHRTLGLALVCTVVALAACPIDIRTPPAEPLPDRVDPLPDRVDPLPQNPPCSDGGSYFFELDGKADKTENAAWVTSIHGGPMGVYGIDSIGWLYSRRFADGEWQSIGQLWNEPGHLNATLWTSPSGAVFIAHDFDLVHCKQGCEQLANYTWSNLPDVEETSLCGHPSYAPFAVMQLEDGGSRWARFETNAWTTQGEPSDQALRGCFIEGDGGVLLLGSTQLIRPLADGGQEREALPTGTHDQLTRIDGLLTVVGADGIWAQAPSGWTQTYSSMEVIPVRAEPVCETEGVALARTSTGSALLFWREGQWQAIDAGFAASLQHPHALWAPIIEDVLIGGQMFNMSVGMRGVR